MLAQNGGGASLATGMLLLLLLLYLAVGITAAFSLVM